MMFSKNHSSQRNISTQQDTYNNNRPKSAGRIRYTQNNSNENANYQSNVIQNTTNYQTNYITSSVEKYFEKRHNDTIDKLNKIKIEKEKKTESELLGRPKLSENTKIITEKINYRRNVFDRLTNKGDVLIY